MARFFIDQLEPLTPKNDRQAAAKAQANPDGLSCGRLNGCCSSRSGQNAVPVPLLVALVSWLAAIFLSFGLFAAPNSTVSRDFGR